ncbi:MAG TPA: hypothetical protein VFR78_21170 [Pyrinomonadaceae bacterium]|nr:hypothetical protein [Pyrinomonadaceae bacterium]
MTYIEELQEAIRHLYHAEAIHVETVPVHEQFQGQTVWDGEVEVFDLAGSAEASRVYAWSYETDQADDPKRTVTVLHVPPVTSPEMAVRASIVRDYREREEKH